MDNSPPIIRNILLLYLFRLFQKTIFSLPIQIIYFAGITQNYAFAMSLYSISHLTTVALELPTGCFSDKFGRKWVCVLGAAGLFLSSLFYAFGNAYFWLVCGAVLTGANKALASGNDETLLYETMNQIGRKKDYLEVLSKMTSLGQLGLCIAAAVGGLVSLISLHAVMYATILPMGLAFFISLFLVEPEHLEKSDKHALSHVWDSFKYLIKNKRLAYLTAGEACHNGLSEAAFAFNPIFFKLFVPVWSLGVFRALGHLCGTLGSYFSYRFCHRFGIQKTFLFGAFSNNIINIISVLANGLLSPFIKLGSSFVNSMKDPPTNTLMQNEIPNTKRATVLSISSLLNSLVFACSTVFVGALADTFSPYWAMLRAYTLALLSNFLFVCSLKFDSADKVLFKKTATKSVSE